MENISCFSYNLSELGTTKEIQFKIELTSKDAITFRPYRLSHSEREYVRKEIDSMKRAGIICDSESNYSSPILLVNKKNGEKRICIDYRALNKITKKMQYPLPLIHDNIDRLRNKKLFTALDMKSGYHQIPVCEESRHLTAFVTPDGHFEFLRMPFGVCNGPAVFQQLINKVLGPLRFTIALAYFDDILIPSDSENEGLENLKIILETLRKANLKLNISKCKFLFTKIEYLGFEIESGLLRPAESKIESVAKFPKPTDVHKVRQFLGLASYFRQFVYNFGVIAQPLTKLTRKNAEWKWTTEEEEAFQLIKAKLISRPVLCMYSPHARTEVHTDACQFGFGGILLQEQADNKLHPVAYISKQTTPEESRYHSTELETLAVVWTLQKLRVYLVGIKFVVVTDCNAVRSTFSKKDIIPRIGRWWLRLSEFQFDIIHRSGNKMQHVDSLSRNPVGNSEQIDTVAEVLSLYTTLSEDEWIILLQKTDPLVNEIMNSLHKTADLDDYDKNIKSQYALKNNAVFRKVGEDLKFYVPRKARWKIVNNYHDNFAHIGLDKTVAKIKENYWFPRMKNYVKNYIGACAECLYHKQPGGRRPGMLHPIDKIGIPFHTVHLDHLGPFVKSAKGNSYVLAAIDGFTKFCILKAVRNTKSITTVRVVEDMMAMFGTPNRFITDLGTSFTGTPFVNFCKINNIVHIKNATATPRANGQIERLNRSITPMIATMCKQADNKDWDNFVGIVQYSLNNTYHRTIKTTPFKLLLSYSPRNVSGGVLEDVLRQQNSDHIDNVRELALKSIIEEQNKQKHAYDKARCEATTYYPGDYIMIKRVTMPESGKSSKLLPHYKGPYIITEVLPNDRYRISDIPGMQRTQKRYEGVVAVDQMKRILTPDDEVSEDHEDANSDQLSDNSSCALRRSKRLQEKSQVEK